MSRLTIGGAAQRAGMRPSAVRFYERQGLVSSQRLANGYRIYDREALSALRFISRAKALGFSLAEIGEILAVRRNGVEPCGCVKAFIDRNLREVDARIRALSRLRRQLRGLAERPASATRSNEICPIIESEQQR
jgi:MerR family Zn(II)-responsive transcriptional regulator of zntA